MSTTTGANGHAPDIHQPRARKPDHRQLLRALQEDHVNGLKAPTPDQIPGSGMSRSVEQNMSMVVY